MKAALIQGGCDFGIGVLIQKPILFAPARVLLFSLGQSTQFVIPIGLQGIGHQSVIGIDLHISALSQVCFITSALDLFLTQPVCFLEPGLKQTGCVRNKSSALVMKQTWLSA